MKKLIYLPDEKVEKTIDGVTFVCRPPTGVIELAMSELHVSHGNKTEEDTLQRQNNMREYRDRFIDIILVDWRGENLPKFQTPASSVLISTVKTELMSWYQDLMSISEEEVKN
jgi:hypothetical protein